jgi:hypothetical protein
MFNYLAKKLLLSQAFNETTTYVRNIFKYYAACKLMVVQMEEQRKARKQVETGKRP